MVVRASSTQTKQCEEGRLLESLHSNNFPSLSIYSVPAAVLIAHLISSLNSPGGRE